MALITSVINRLKEVNHPVFKDRIAGAWSYDVAKSSGSMKAPKIYVIYGVGQQAGETNKSGGAGFDWRETFMVSVIAKPEKAKDEDHTLHWANDVISDIQCVIWDALVAWTPEGYDGSVIVPVNTVPGKTWKDKIEIMLTFKIERSITRKRPPEKVAADHLLRFGAAIGCGATSQPIKLDMCERNGCDIKTPESDTSGDNKPSNAKKHHPSGMRRGSASDAAYEDLPKGRPSGRGKTSQET